MRKAFILLALSISMLAGTLQAQSWTEVSSGTSYILYSMHFPPDQNDVGYAAGMQYTYNAPGVIVKTLDGGQTWSQILPTSGTIDGLQAICFLTDSVGYAGGWNNYFIKTEDGGASWTEMTLGSDTDIWYFVDIEFWDEDNGVAAAMMYTGGGQPIFITDDGGDTWTQATSGMTQNVLDVTYATSTTLYAVGTGNSVSKSTDGGYTWSTIYTASGILFGVSFADANFGVVGGEDGYVFATNNGGSSWSSYDAGYENFWATKAFDGDSAYIGGTDENIVKTLDGGATWISEYNGTGTSTLYKFQFSANNTGHICGSQGRMLYKEAPLSADFEADQTTICVGGTVNFTDLSTAATSWSWTFEGGTPATSTDQHPSVTYNGTGTFNVELTVSDGSGTLTELKPDYITVKDTPEKADTPDGESNTCTSNFYEYTIDPIEFAEAYEWEISTTDAGTLSWDENEATLETADDWTGDFTLKVRASNLCGDGEWSDEFSISLFQSPNDYEVQGGGSYCLGGDGVEITLSGSDAGIDYELYLGSDPTGIILTGDGNPLNFGLQTDEGYYSVKASNDNCNQAMTGQVQVSIDYPPLEPGTPTGPEIICNEESSDYETEGVEEADSYGWSIDPEEAGTLYPNGMEVNVLWNADFTGTAYLSVYGINECGDGNDSEALEIDVDGTPVPEVEGAAEACDFSSEIYTVAEMEGATFTWEVDGGSVSDGQGTNQVTIDWGGVGNGSINVAVETENGCEGESETFEVMIDDCTDIPQNNEQLDMRLYPNPAQDRISVEFKSMHTGNIEIRIYDLDGKVVKNMEQAVRAGDQKLTLEIQDLANGLYVIKGILNGSQILDGKFNKMKK